ncbi:MAG: hypothetical protein PHT07_15220 [Paludibacter sp.]|nr:hypothetical protein [Paludibacter sp.]
MGMIFARHDFTENFFNAIGYQDKFMENQILIDEIARIIVDDKKSVVDRLRGIGINVTYKDNNDYIKSYVVKEITNGNDKVIRFFSDKIVKNQVDESKVKGVLNALGDVGIIKVGKVPEKEQTKTGQILSAIISNPDIQEGASNIIADGIKNLFSKNNANKVANDQQLSERLKLNEMKSADKTKPKYVVLKVIGALILAGGLGYIIYLLATKKDSGSPAHLSAPPVNTTPISQ